MTLSHEKYNKFLHMMQLYPNIKQESNYFLGNHRNQWNKTPKEKITQVIELYNSGIISTKEISEKLNLHRLKVQRIFQENNLGKRILKTSEEKRKEIAEFVSKNQHLNCNQIGEIFKISSSAVSRACKKYGVKKLDSNKYRISQMKIFICPAYL